MPRVLPIAALCVVVSAGCHRPVQPVDLTTQRVSLATEEAFERLWQSSQAVLRRHHFELDRVDERSGTITTRPVTSQSLLEFWRHDVDTGFDLLEASLRTVRRSVEVQVDRGAVGEAADVTVTVKRETFATPERQFNTSSSVLRIFGEGLPGVAGEPYLTREFDYWVDDGRDAAMEARLLDGILSDAGVSLAVVEAAGQARSGPAARSLRSVVP